MTHPDDSADPQTASLKVSRIFPGHGAAIALVITTLILLSPGAVRGQTVFTVNNLAPIVSTGASVSITAPDPLFQNAGTVSGSIKPVTFGTNIDFYSPGPSFGASDPGFKFNGAITGTTITAGTVIPVSYGFTLGKNAYVNGSVTWTLSFSDDQNSTPFVIATGTLSTAGAASQTFSGTGNSYSFTNGSSSTFTASLSLSYTTGAAMANPDVTISMTDSGFRGQGITLGASAIPEPSTYAAIAGVCTLGFVCWQRRRRAGTAIVGVAR